MKSKIVHLVVTYFLMWVAVSPSKIWGRWQHSELLSWAVLWQCYSVRNRPFSSLVLGATL